MNIIKQTILEEYAQQKNDFAALGLLAAEKIEQAISQADIKILSVSQRVKTEKSLSGKIDAKDGKYRQLSDITDILGVRVICYFSDDVDRISRCIEKLFVIDKENSVDKRLLLEPNVFGYLSVHYICSLKAEEGYAPALLGKKFEVQIRTILQHTWAEITHDLGYKSEFSIPRSNRREFSRIAGLLEIADEQFIQVRDSIEAYCTEVREKIAQGTAHDVPIDLASLEEFMRHNIEMRSFLQELGAICGAEIQDVTPESYLVQLAFLGKKTLGDLSVMLQQNRRTAYRLAQQALHLSELDIISSNAGLRYLCRAELQNGAYSEEEAVRFLMLSLNNEQRAKRQAQALLQDRH